MFLTLNQALAMSPVGMAIVEQPYKQLVKLNPDGTYRVLLSNGEKTWGETKTAIALDRVNRAFVLKNINCRPVMDNDQEAS